MAVVSRVLYSLLLRLLCPFEFLRFLWRNQADRGGLKDLLALQGVSRLDLPLWLHAASAGEVQALGTIVQSLAARGLPLLLTVRTPTGLARARELHAGLLQASGGLEPRLTLRLAPWDLPGASARFIAAARPRAAVFVETELWPNLVAACHRANVPLLLVSARLSARSLQRYQRFAPRLLQHTVRAFAAIEAQTTMDRERFIALGAAAANVTVGGNLKFDLPLPENVAAAGAQLRAVWAPERSMWVAGSTHPGEEAACIEAHLLLMAGARAAGRATPLLVLAPRRPERFNAVAAWLTTTGLRVRRRSDLADDAVCSGEAVDVLLLDCMGELLHWYAAADAVFVGGSLVPVGGHNLLEPAALARPVITGPHCFNAPQVAQLLAAADALITVIDAAELAHALERVLADATQAQARGARAAAVVMANRGAAQRALSAIAKLPQCAEVTAPA